MAGSGKKREQHFENTNERVKEELNKDTENGSIKVIVEELYNLVNDKRLEWGHLHV